MAGKTTARRHDKASRRNVKTPVEIDQPAPVEVGTAGTGPLIGLLTLLIVTAAVYSQVICHSFILWDDDPNVCQNSHLVNHTGMDLRFFWIHSYEALYIPVSYMVYGLLVHLATASMTDTVPLLHPWVFHVANLVLHLVNVAIVYAILRRLTKSNGPSLIGSLLFSMHPLQVESVAWVSELRGVLAAVFCLGAIFAYLCAVDRAGSTDGNAGVPVQKPAYWIALVFTIVALLCKPSAAALPFALFVLDRWAIGRPWRACALSVLPWLIAIVPYAIFTHIIQPVSSAANGPIWQRPFVAGDALAFYLEKLFLPLHLCIVYAKAPGDVLGNAWGYVTWIVPAAVAAIIYKFRRGRPWLVAGGLFSLAILLPVLGLVPFSYQSYSTVADRYMYLAMLGPAMIVAHLLAHAGSAKLSKIGYAVSVAVLAVLATLTVLQTQLWKNGLTLMGYAVATTPGSAAMHNDYGMYLDKAVRYDDAAAQYETAVQEQPGAANMRQNYGDVLGKLGRIQDALGEYQEAVTLDPSLTTARDKLAVALLHTGDVQGAMGQLEVCLTQDPNNASVHTDYASTLLLLGRNDEAVAEFQKALQLNPDDVHALYTLGTLQLNPSSMADAQQNIRKAVGLAPYDPQAHAALAHYYEVNGQIDQALNEYRNAVAAGPTIDRIHMNYGMCLYDHGDKADGMTQFQVAARLNPSTQNLDVVAEGFLLSGNKSEAERIWQFALRNDPTLPLLHQRLARLEGKN